MKVTFETLPTDEDQFLADGHIDPTGIRIRRVGEKDDPPKYELLLEHLGVDHRSPDFRRKTLRTKVSLDERSLLLIAQAIQGHFRPTVESQTLDVLRQILTRLDQER